MLPHAAHRCCPSQAGSTLYHASGESTSIRLSLHCVLPAVADPTEPEEAQLPLEHSQTDLHPAGPACAPPAAAAPALPPPRAAAHAACCL